MSGTGVSPAPIRELVVGADPDAVAALTAMAVVEAAGSAIDAAGRFTIALAGGGTPRRLYRWLATAHRHDVAWPAVHVFFGDERCVPPADSASNYAMASAELLSHVPIPEDQVHRIRGELTPADAAHEYDRLLRDFFALAGRPAFDLVLLGVGTDGHTASLFPGDPALDEHVRWAVAVEAPPSVEPRHRVTLTLPVLNGAREVYLLAVGSEKREVTQAILGGRASAAPAALVHGTHRTVWFGDPGAARISENPGSHA